MKPNKGAYIIEINLSKDSEMLVGRLGRINFKKGIYYYAGSSQNSLDKRVERHKKNGKKIHWHIDYLTAHPDAKVIRDKKFLNKPKDYECFLAKKMSKKCLSIKGFGCSDCKCISHLYYKPFP